MEALNLNSIYYADYETIILCMIAENEGEIQRILIHFNKICV